MWLFFFSDLPNDIVSSVVFSCLLYSDHNIRSELQTPSLALSLTSSLSIISLTLHEPLLWLCMAFGYFS